MSWLGGCRRLHRRYERKAEHFLAFIAIACSLICYRRLTNETTSRRDRSRRVRRFKIGDRMHKVVAARRPQWPMGWPELGEQGGKAPNHAVRP
ncbi:hypothetical protein GCM10010244_85020 [Streptomyces coeruleorubidus]|nr:hypothetical protein GCM10010244_85020 [Streptomyces bellus]